MVARTRWFILIVAIAIVAAQSDEETTEKKWENEELPEQSTPDENTLASVDENKLASDDELVDTEADKFPAIYNKKEYLTEAEKREIENNATCDIVRTVEDASADYLLCGASHINMFSLRDVAVVSACHVPITQPNGAISYNGYATTFVYPPGSPDLAMPFHSELVTIQFVDAYDLGITPEQFAGFKGNTMQALRMFTFLADFKDKHGVKVKRYARFRTKVIWMAIKCYAYGYSTKPHRITPGGMPFLVDNTQYYMLYVIIDDLVSPEDSFAIVFTTFGGITDEEMENRQSCDMRGIQEDFGGLLNCPDADKFREFLRNKQMSFVK